MDSKLAPLVKKGGIIALAFPGLKEELNGAIPSEMALSWPAEDIETWHSCEWWKSLLKKSCEITVESISEMQGFDEYWNDWLYCTNEFSEHARLDRAAMEAGAGKYMNFISVIGSKI